MIFYDSSFLIGFFIKNDDFHMKAHELRKILHNEKILINNVVLCEILNSLKITNNMPNYIGNIDELFNFLIKYTEIHYLTPEDYAEALNLFKYYNHSINFSDCAILITMNKYNIRTIVSFDSDFDKIKHVDRIYL